MKDDAWERLGQQLIARRVRLGYRNRAEWFRHLGIDNKSGPRRTIEDVEAGRRDNYTPATKAQIENWYEWETGSLDRVLVGEEATDATLSPWAATSIVHGLAEAQRYGEESVDLEQVIAAMIETLHLAQRTVRAQNRYVLLLGVSTMLNHVLQQVGARQQIAGQPVEDDPAVEAARRDAQVFGLRSEVQRLRGLIMEREAPGWQPRERSGGVHWTPATVARMVDGHRQDFARSLEALAALVGIEGLSDEERSEWSALRARSDQEEDELQDAAYVPPAPMAKQLDDPDRGEGSQVPPEEG